MSDSSRVVGWKAYYADGSIYRSDRAAWDRIPDDGLVAVSVFESDKDRFGRNIKVIRNGSDWYFSDGDQLIGSNSDPLNENAKRYPQCSFKRGKWVSLELYGEILKRAREDFECPAPTE